ncbi:DNA double-strand break repair nuclease NurA [Vulcanisaeta sp. JCM 16159]|uniref:DNA double-strand break repair nuclease NurA n=1 Tax=Vulcanisaeta sp. JCM 16159 TaxID=1295371 RepID=UPI0006D255B3|nr:DNA double-strand break repair nuclease NurA [Vulcanisaeta sp. JCM 16159]
MADIFYDIYYKRLIELNGAHGMRRINATHDMLSRIINASDIKDLWKPLPVLNRTSDAKAVAVDGGVRELELRDGSAIVIARAIAVNNAGEQPTRDVIVNWVPVFTPSIKWVLLSYIESEVALRAITGGRYNFLLLDGSLYAKITALIHELILTKGFLDLYYIPEVIRALESLYNLLDRARELGVNIIFVAKDSKLKIFKDYILFKALKEIILSDAPFINVSKELLDVLNRGIDWYSIVWIRNYRNKLLSLAKNYNGVHKDLIRIGIRMVLSQSISDVILLEELARGQGIRIGTTRRLLIGAMDAYLNHKSLTQVDNLLKFIKDRIEDSEGLRTVDDYGNLDIADELNRVRRVLVNFPRIVMTYVKFHESDSPITVEIPYYDWPMFNQGVPWKLFYDKIDINDHLNLLMSMYRDPIHYNKLLWLAHEYANFGEDQFLEYVMAAVNKLKIQTKRRFGMAFNIDLNPQPEEAQD